MSERQRVRKEGKRKRENAERKREKGETKNASERGTKTIARKSGKEAEKRSERVKE